MPYPVSVMPILCVERETVWPSSMATLRNEPARVCAYCALHPVKPNPVNMIFIISQVFVFDFFYALMCGAGDGVAIFDGDLAERTRAGLRILRSSLREVESRPHDIMKNSTSCEMLFFGGITQT